jgi:hypothetical protein
VIEITRDAARQLRAVFRRSAWPAGDRRSPAPVVLRSDDRQLTVHSTVADLGALWTRPGAADADTIVLPGKGLADFEGRDGSPVRLQCIAFGKVRAEWHDRGVLVTNVYDLASPEPPPAFPPPPDAFAPVSQTFLTALDEAAKTASKDGTRIALSRVQLRGSKGSVLATDGRQLLIHDGFNFPWPDDLLVPPVAAFGLKELAREGPPTVACTANHVFVRAGPWTIALPIDRASRFPDAEAVIPRVTGRATRWRVAAEEVEFLVRALPRLPASDCDHSPVTLDLGEPVAVRARADGQDRATELVLPRSQRDGPPVRLCMNRTYLLRALALGFTEFVAARADAPLQCQDGKRRYVWMTLDGKTALPPRPDDLRIDQATAAEGVSPRRATQAAAGTPIDVVANKSPLPVNQAPRNSPMANKSPTNGPPAPADNGGGERTPAGSGPDALLEEAQALYGVLREALGRVNQLMTAIKLERRQRRLVQTTLASLRQLQ